MLGICGASWNGYAIAMTSPCRKRRWRRSRLRCRRCANHSNKSAICCRLLPTSIRARTSRYSNSKPGLAGRSADQLAVAAHRAAAGNPRVAGDVALGKRADWRSHRQSAAKFHDQRQHWLHEYGAGEFAGPQNLAWLAAGNVAQTYSMAALCFISFKGLKRPRTPRLGVIAAP